MGCSAGLPGRQSRGRSARGRVAEEYQARQSPSCPTAPPRAVAGALKTVRGSGAGIATKLAIEFLTLTATRSSEVRLGIWSEVDFEEAVWRVPAERAKTKRTHEVPLSGRTVAILAEAREITDGSGLIFPSPKGQGVIEQHTFQALSRARH